MIPNIPNKTGTSVFKLLQLLSLALYLFCIGYNGVFLKIV